MHSIAEALHRLDKYRFPGTVPDKYMSLDALDAVAAYIEAVEKEVGHLEDALTKSEIEVKDLKAELLLAAELRNTQAQQLGVTHIKLSAIAMLLKA